MEGFVTVVCKIKMEDNKGELPVIAKALIPNPQGPYSEKGYPTIKASCKYPISFSQLRLNCAYRGMLQSLDDKDGVKFTHCPASFFKVLNPDGTYTYKVRVSFGTEKLPIERTFKLKALDAQYLETFKALYEFTLLEKDEYDEEKEAEDTIELDGEADN